MKKKVVICSSISFHKEIKEWKEKLEKKGYDVIKYPDIIGQDSLQDYKITHTEHYKKIAETDILFILNVSKDGYIGPSVFAEISFAIGLNILRDNNDIEIYYLNYIPKNLPYSEELYKWQDLGWIIHKDISTTNK